jgi:hypothetical protein
MCKIQRIFALPGDTVKMCFGYSLTTFEVSNICLGGCLVIRRKIVQIEITTPVQSSSDLVIQMVRKIFFTNDALRYQCKLANLKYVRVYYGILKAQNFIETNFFPQLKQVFVCANIFKCKMNVCRSPLLILF